MTRQSQSQNNCLNQTPTQPDGCLQLWTRRTGRGQARLCWAPGSTHNRPTTSPPTALNPSLGNLGIERQDLCRHGSASLQTWVRARAAAALVFGGCSGCGKLAGPKGLMEKEGAQSQAPRQTALIRANDCTSPLPGCFINTAINSPEAASLASRRSDRSRRFAGWGSA